MIPNNVKNWICSFSGCDGGNIQADIWLCGIEWGAGSEIGYYDKELPDEIKKGAVASGSKIYNWKESLTYPYGRSFAKLYKSIKGESVEDYKSVSNLPGDEIFKLNLYPIAFDSTDPKLWHQYGLSKITGFEDKNTFNTWCFFNRLPYFHKIADQHKPKLIIGTGIDYIRDFLMAFGGINGIDELNVYTIEPQSVKNNTIRKYYWVKISEHTTLVVIPFFSGKYGLNSNYLLQEMGERIKKGLVGSI